MDFKGWLKLNEMASFTIPNGVRFQIPCTDATGNCSVAGIDMRFEFPPQIRDKAGKVLNQWSMFVAKFPRRNDYLVYDGPYGVRPKPVSAEEAKVLVLDKNYTMIPDGWWERAEAVDDEDHVIKPQ